MSRRVLLSTVLCLASVCTTLAGFGALLHFESSADKPNTAPQMSLSHRGLQSGKQQTLTVFFHPKCPCSRATLHQVERLLAKSQEGLAVNLVFCIPPAADNNFASGDIYSEARSIPGVNIVIDHSASIAKSFGAHASGACYLVDAHGRLLFCGGITEGRGHEGEGESFLLLANAMSSAKFNMVSVAPVYGCQLVSSQENGLCNR